MTELQKENNHSPEIESSIVSQSQQSIDTNSLSLSSNIIDSSKSFINKFCQLKQCQETQQLQKN